MTTYGNAYWNKATDNSTISVIPMREETFLKLQHMLEDAGLNYYAFAQNGALKMAVNDKDMDWLKRIIGSPAADNLTVQKSSKPYSPPNMNIIGNTEYKYMPKKSYFKTDRDVALKMAELLEREGIKFSGRIYANSDTATLTVSEPDMVRLKAINQQVIAMRSSIAKSEPPKDKEIIGNTEYKNIQQRHYIFSKATPEQYKKLQPYLDEQGVQYSGLIRNDKVMFTVSECDSVRFYQAMNTAINMVMIHEELEEENFSEAQIKSLSSLIKEAAQRDLPYEVARHLSPEYSEKQLSEMIPLVSAYVNASETERILDKNDVLSNILAAKSRFDSEIAIREVTSKHDYSDEQKAALLEAFQNGVSLGALDELDESYSPDEVAEFAEIMSCGDADRMMRFIEKHQEKQLEAETKQPIGEKIQPVIENERQTAFNIPSITDSLKADFESDELTFKEVATELKYANLIPHERDYERVAEILDIDKTDSRISEYFTEKTSISAEQNSSEPTDIGSEKNESKETGENQNVRSENDTPHKSYRIYQIKGGDEYHGIRFSDYSTLDKVKNGGIVAFVTSAGMLDKRDESTRQMFADKADFIGAVRLPGGKNGAFKDYAGTEATTDIIFLQKHDNKSVSEMSDVPDWVHIGQTEDGLPINKYFENNPDMVLGTVIEGNKLYGTGTMVVAEDGFDLKTALHEAVSKLSAQISDEHPRDVYPKAKDTEIRPPEELRNYSLFEHENKIYFKLSDTAYNFKYDSKNSMHQRAKAFISLRDCTRELLTAQEQNKPDDVIKGLQEQLNTLYDDFYKKYGLLHSQTNKRYFSEDVSYNLVASLEKSYEKDKLLEKSDMFTKRTIKPAKAITHVDSAMEALALSAAEKACVDFEYMQNLTGMTKDELLNDLRGEIFLVPNSVDMYQTASEYLSGDIRQKMKTAQEAAETDSRFAVNVAALEKVMPEPLKAADIDVRLGAAAWIDPKIYQQFMYETFETPNDKRDRGTSSLWRWSKPIKLEYSDATGTYHIQNKRADMSVTATKTFGTSRMNAYEITEHLLNLKDPKLYKTVLDENGDEKRVLDPDATRIVQSKADKIKAEFKDWIFKDPERREQLVQQYNEKFNCIRPREYDGSHLSFPNMNAEIKLHNHQKNAIAHALFGGNTLFAHSVGAGKTFEMIATAMESKRLGLCTKSLFAVPNHLTEQIGDDFLKLYPSANVLVATKNDFKKENRQQLFAKIATGNFDAVIIGHSQLGMIPISKERQVALLQEQIDDVIKGISELKHNEGSKFQVKAMERTRKSLQKQLDKLDKSHDDTISFEQMGIDKLFVDEAHEFKNLFTPTKLQNVSGISNSASQKALDLFLKCRYLDEKTDGKGVVFATGTPLSNSVTELHTMMRYLEYDFLKEKNLQHFDNWVTVFGERKTDWELAPAGNKFKERTRIANYTGLPELMSMFKQIADIKTADSLKLDVPECEMHVVNVEATEFQKTLVDELAARADDVQSGNVDPSIDNMLRITSDGRKLGLDPRLIDPSFEDNPNTKLNQCVENVFRIYEDTTEDKLTQIVFCDLGVPHKTVSTTKDGADAEEVSAAEANSLEEECDFCVYDDIKQKLMDKGVPEKEIAYIHSAKTEKQKSELFDKVRSGEVRVLLGSTGKMGTGTNVQKRLIAVHDLDIPWRPADLEQRAGRIIRQGNQNKNVHIFRYVTKGTFDAYSYQTLESKQKFISQIMTSKTPVRKCEDVDQQALTYSEIKALCTGDERIKEKMQLDNEVKELRLMKAEHTNTVYEMQDKIRAFPAEEKRLTSLIKGLETDRDHIDRLPVDSETMQPKFKITIGDTVYTDRKEAAQAFEDATYNAIKVMDTSVKIGEFQGFPLSVQMDSFSKNVTATLSGSITHRAELIGSFPHNLKRLESALYSVDDKIKNAYSNLSALRIDLTEAEKLAVQTFPREAELAQKEERLGKLTTELNEAAAEAMKNKPQQRTCYFDRAKLKKEATKSRASAKKQSEKKKTKTSSLGDE